MSVEPEISYCEQQARSIEDGLRNEMLCVKAGAVVFGVSVAMFVAAFILDSATLAVMTIFVMTTAAFMMIPAFGLFLYQDEEIALAEKWRARDRLDKLDRIQAEDLRNFRLGRPVVSQREMDPEHRAALERVRAEARMPIEEWIARHP